MSCGQSLWFSLPEFSKISGLDCGKFQEDYDLEHELVIDVKKDPMWRKLIGSDPKATLGDVAHMLKSSSDGMSSWSKLGLALILIVDVESFLGFPCGRESFIKIVSSMKPGKKIRGKCEDPIATFRQQLQQQTMKMEGFPLIIQLLALRSIPSLLNKLPNASDGRTFLETPFDCLPKFTPLSMEVVIDVEHDPEVSLLTVY